jgi:hypothetical protein
MISLVTLAHRVSSIHARYSGIHASIFAFSLSSLHLLFWKKQKLEYCRYETELAHLIEELAEARSIIAGEEELEPATTVGREFAFALDVYIIALSDTVERLLAISSRLCRDSKGLEKYTGEQTRSDRLDYDIAVQQYRRLGERLEFLFKRL